MPTRHNLGAAVVNVVVIDAIALRKALGTQTEVAQLLGIGRRTLARYENEGQPPRLYLLALEALAEKKSADLADPRP